MTNNNNNNQGEGIQANDSDERMRTIRRSDGWNDDSEEEEEEDEALKETCVGKPRTRRRAVSSIRTRFVSFEPASLALACIGNGGSPTACRFFAKRKRRFEKVAGWPQCPPRSAKKVPASDASGTASRRAEIGWRMHVKDISWLADIETDSDFWSVRFHGARTKRLGDTCSEIKSAPNGYCRDAKTRARVSILRKSGAKLGAEKSPRQWPTCPAAVCEIQAGKTIASDARIVRGPIL